jgi:hypothetical protein
MFLSPLVDDAFTGEMIGIMAAGRNVSKISLEYTFNIRDAQDPGL